MKNKQIIMVVDDQVQSLDLFEAYLLPYDYEIVKAVNGEDALNKLSCNKIDLILLDVMMPGMNGFDVTRRIREDDKYRLLPIILITALRETEDRINGIEAGCDDFISKPIDKMELLARVRSLLKVKAYNDLMANYRNELESEVETRTRELVVLNSSLEKKVEERTAGLNQSLIIQNDLNSKLAETAGCLEKEKDLLKIRNQIMEDDLDMARNIQKCFIPDKSPVPYISFKYKPMEKVGGDFFDFIMVADSDWIGIFISDVSGHGVQAALITAMIKSSISQIFPYINNPSRVMELLNDILINNTAGNFVTAFYGCYKPETREFIYSNAGHNYPYIINNDAIEYLNINSKAIPLAILNNNELKTVYSNETSILKKGSKLILYTDGFTETVNFNYLNNLRGNDFEEERLLTSFRTHFNRPAEFFLEGIYQDLVAFRGSDDFEDDVCIICVDVE